MRDFKNNRRYSEVVTIIFTEILFLETNTRQIPRCSASYLIPNCPSTVYRTNFKGSV